MKTLAKIMSGSRQYGTNTPESDYDYKVLFLPSIEDLLMGRRIDISKKRPEGLGPNDKMIDGEEESEHIPLQKAAKDFMDGQTYALELFFAINQNYMIDLYGDTHLKEFTKELIDKFLNNNISKMCGYAISQAQVYGLKGERLATIEKLILDLDQMLEEKVVSVDDRLFALEGWLSQNKTDFLYLTKIKGTKAQQDEQPAIQINNRTYSLTTAVGHFRKALDILKSKYGTRAIASQEGTDWKALSHAVRVADEARNLLTTGQLTFPSKIAPLLLQIKQGQIAYEEALAIFNKINIEMEATLKTTKIQGRTPELAIEFNDWLSKQLLKFYNIQEQ